MKYSETESTEIKYYSETETTEIKKCSESEGTGIAFNPLKITLLLLTLIISTSAISNEVHLYQSNNNQVKGVMLVDKTSYFFVGNLEGNILTANILDDHSKSTDEGTGKSTDDGTGDESTDDGTGKSTDEGTGDESTDDGTGKSTDDGTGKSTDEGTGKSHFQGTLSIILECGISEGIIENLNGNTLALFEGQVIINGNKMKCSK